MGEHLTRLEVAAFRGVPEHFALDFPYRGLLAYGDNGTGKSTIADALEWYFNGRIDHLAHEGREKAIRHLAAPDRLKTSVTVHTSGDLGGTSQYPNDAPSNRNLGTLETFLLRGRTLADFVNKTKGEKWKALAEILGLDAVDNFRLDLQSARNELRKLASERSEIARAARVVLEQRINDATDQGICDAVYVRCDELRVDRPASLEKALDPQWAESLLASGGGHTEQRELKALADEADALSLPDVDLDPISRWNERVEADGVDTELLRVAEAGDTFLAKVPEPRECPLCGQSIDAEELDSRVRRLLSELQASAFRLETEQHAALAALETISASHSHRSSFCDRARRLQVDLDAPPSCPTKSLESSLRGLKTVALSEIRRYFDDLAAWDIEAAARVQSVVKEKTVKQGSPILDLWTLLDEARKYKVAQTSLERAARAQDAADTVLGAYQRQQQQYFEQILDRISVRVGEIYEKLHPGEHLQSVSVELWGKKGVELSLDFHGMHQRPPHGVLSESHLNSLAIALFLAMAETFNEDISFLVLDDIVNSFDAEHRDQLAKVLTQDFADWQLLILTHDHQFFQRLAILAPQFKKMAFTSWSFEAGPRTTEYRVGTTLELARRDLNEGDAMGAAQKGRRALEELLQEICEALQAPLPFRRGVKNDQREVVELLKGVRRALKDTAKSVLDDLAPLLRDLEADTIAALNVESHAGKGSSALQELARSLERVENLDRHWTCPDCHTRLWSRGTPDSGRCRCGKARYPPLP